MVGRPPKPIALRALEGDTRRQGANKHAATLAAAGDLPAGLPTAPKGMSKLAKAHWKYLMDCASAEKLLREVDGGTLAGVCEMFGAFMLQTAAADSMGRLALNESLPVEQRFDAQDRALKASRAAVQSYRAYVVGADRLGLSGSARARLNLPLDPERPTSLDDAMDVDPVRWKARR